MFPLISRRQAVIIAISTVGMLTSALLFTIIFIACLGMKPSTLLFNGSASDETVEAVQVELHRQAEAKDRMGAWKRNLRPLEIEDAEISCGMPSAGGYLVIAKHAHGELIQEIVRDGDTGWAINDLSTTDSRGNSLLLQDCLGEPIEALPFPGTQHPLEMMRDEIISLFPEHP